MFTQRVYEVVRQIPAGKVMTYQDVAIAAGSPKAVRAVGAAMHNNPDASTIPCHRVVASDGRMMGYAFGGVSAKEARLRKEGVVIINGRVDLAVSRWQP